MNIILMGGVGSGKSTQGNLLAESLHIPYLATGEIFRNLAREDTPLAKEIISIMSSGQLVPDDKAIELVKSYLEKPEYASGFILDGFPRTLNQAASFPTKIDKVIYYKISDETMLQRIMSRNEGRIDDTEEVIKKRIQVFHEETLPVIEFYREKGLLLEINAEQTVEEIFQSTLPLVKT